jgi:hypothetical protein
MTTPPLTHAESRLIDDCAAQQAVLARLPHHTETDAEAIQRERGWMEAIEHLARRKGLSLAGLVEAQKLVAANRDWVQEYTADETGRGR